MVKVQVNSCINKVTSIGPIKQDKKGELYFDITRVDNEWGESGIIRSEHHVLVEGETKPIHPDTMEKMIQLHEMISKHLRG